jgi:hypothetical protein
VNEYAVLFQNPICGGNCYELQLVNAWHFELKLTLNNNDFENHVTASKIGMTLYQVKDCLRSEIRVY